MQVGGDPIPGARNGCTAKPIFLLNEESLRTLFMMVTRQVPA